MGVARIDPQGAPDAALERAIKLADRALDHSKKAGGKNSVSEVADDGSFRLRDRSQLGARPPRIERPPVWETPEYQQSLKALGQTELESFLHAIHTDPKTGLGNRESIRENLAERLGVFDRLYKVEIDNFKAVNDHAELGHDAGDVMFKEFGKVVLEVRAEIAKELGVPESQVLHAARVVSKDFHVLAKDRTGELFGELLPKRLAEGDRLLAAVARHKFGAGDPAFQPTAKQVEQVRSWVAEQAKATGKDPARVGTATGHLVKVEVPAHGDKGAAYDRAVQDATTVIEAQKAWRNAAARTDLGAGALAARVPVERYIPFETFKKLHPSLESGEVYHNYLHSMKVADMAFALASKRLPGDQAALVAEIAMLHDLDPLREPGKAARVPATIELLRADFEGRMSIHGEKGRSALKEVFGWDERKLAIAEAMIQRTEFPFDATHKNPAYAGSGNSPPERYEAMLRKLSPADQKFVLEEAAMLSEFADKSSWYATENFNGAAKIVDALAGEINAGIGKPVMDFSKLDTAGFLSTIGTEGAYAFDRGLAAKLGLPELGLLSRSQAWSLLPEHGKVFEANLKGFENAKAALAKGESIDAAKALGAASAEAKLKEPVFGAGDQPSTQAARTALEAMDPAGVRGLASKADADLLGLPGVSGGSMRDLEPKSLKALENLAADLSVRILGDPSAPAGRASASSNADAPKHDWTGENQKAFGAALEKSFGSLAKDGPDAFDRKAITAAAEVVDALPAKVERTGPADAKAAADLARGEASARLVQEYLGLAERPRAALPETMPTSGADVYLMQSGGKTIGVYKVYPKAHAEQMLADELAAGKILEGFGLKRSALVRPLGTFRHGDSGEMGLLMEAAPGKDLFGKLREVGRLAPGSGERVEALSGAEEQVRAVAESMAELHRAGKGSSISTKARRETLAKTLEYVNALASPAGNGNFADSSIPPEVAQALKAKLKAIGKDYVRGKSPGAIVHGDSHPGNFMVQDGKVVIIDAESLIKSVGPGLKGTESPMADVARFLESLPTNNKIKGVHLEPGEIAAVQKSFLDAYAKSGGLSPEAFQAQIAFFRTKFQVTALRYAANRAEMDLVLDAIRTDLQSGGTGIRSPEVSPNFFKHAERLEILAAGSAGLDPESAKGLEGLRTSLMDLRGEVRGKLSALPEHKGLSPADLNALVLKAASADPAYRAKAAEMLEFLNGRLPAHQRLDLSSPKSLEAGLKDAEAMARIGSEYPFKFGPKARGAADQVAAALDELKLPKDIARAVGVAVLKDGKVLIAFSGNPGNPEFVGPVSALKSRLQEKFPGAEFLMGSGLAEGNFLKLDPDNYAAGAFWCAEKTLFKPFRDKKLSYDQISEVAVRWRGAEPNGEALPHNPNFMKPCAHCLKNSKIILGNDRH